MWQLRKQPPPPPPPRGTGGGRGRQPEGAADHSASLPHSSGGGNRLTSHISHLLSPLTLTGRGKPMTCNVCDDTVSEGEAGEWHDSGHAFLLLLLFLSLALSSSLHSTSSPASPPHLPPPAPSLLLPSLPRRSGRLLLFPPLLSLSFLLHCHYTHHCTPPSLGDREKQA